MGWPFVSSIVFMTTSSMSNIAIAPAPWGAGHVAMEKCGEWLFKWGGFGAGGVTRRLLESDQGEQVAPRTQGDRHATREETAPAAKKSAVPTKAAPQMTVTLKHLAAALSDNHDLPKKQAEAVLGDLVTLTTRHLKKGDKIRLNGLGILQVRKRAARMGRNPATGESIKIKASKKIAFRAAKELKEAV